jgi:hypothetical protein
MINSADEFVRLRTSELREEYLQAAEGEASIAVWMEVIARFPDMREWVALNKTVPLEVLAVLAGDASASVRATVADKRRLSPTLFQSLSLDDDDVVRQRIAYNKKVPPHLLDRLAEDPSPMVREAARMRLRRVGA